MYLWWCLCTTEFVLVCFVNACVSVCVYFVIHCRSVFVLTFACVMSAHTYFHLCYCACDCASV